MGTSSSNPGAGPTSPLVPPWADLDGQGPGPEPRPRRFQQFRTNLGRFVQTGNRGYLRSALGHYARISLGGSNTATRRLAPVARAGGELLSFLSDVAAGGDGASWLGFSIRDLAGRDVDDVIEVIVRALSPPSGPLDDEAIQQGMYQALSSCLEDQVAFDPTALTQEMIANLLQQYLAEEVFIRIMNDSGDAFQKADDPVQAVEAEKELRTLILSVVDVVAGPRFNREGSQMSADEFDRLLQEIIREVFAEFEGYY